MVWQHGRDDMADMSTSNMLNPVSILLLGLSAAAYGAQPSAPLPIPAPLRDLTWGQLNFLHTTDVHGWYSGHLQE